MAIALAVSSHVVCGELDVLRAPDFVGRLADDRVEQVVGLDAEPLAPGDFDERTFRVFGVGCRREAELPGRRVRQRHHLVREVVRALGALGMADVDQRLLQQLLQVRLPHVDHVVDVGGAAKQRMVARAVADSSSPTAVPCGRSAKTR